MKLLPERKQIGRPTEQTLKPTVMQRLEQAHLAVKEFQATHPKIFEEYQELIDNVDVLTNEVKTYCKQHRCNLDSALLVAKFSPAYHRWYDPETLRKELKGALGDAQAVKLIKTMGVITTHEEVDEKVLKTLVHLKKIPEGVMKTAYRQEETQVRVEVKAK